MRWTIQLRALSAALLTLGIGLFVYLFDRADSAAWLIPAWWSRTYSGPHVFGPLGNHLPTFAHAYAFALLTAIVLAPSKRNLIAVCLLWLLVDSLFEVAQLDAISSSIENSVPAWFNDWPLLNNVESYFSVGRFDPFDLLSIVVGAVAAYLTASILTHRGDAQCK